MAHSLKLQSFLDSLEAKPDPRNLAWDTVAVEALDPAERQLAEDALIDRAARLGDLRAIKSLGLLAVKRAAPMLEGLAQSGHGAVRNSAARALGIITGDQATIGSLVDSAGGEVDAFTAWDLKSMSGDEAFRGLLVALHSADLPARMHALDGLAARCGVEALRQPDQAPLGRYEMLLGSGLKALYLPAARALADIFAQLKAGVSPEVLGLPYVASADAALADAYFVSCGTTGKPYADDLIAQMGEHDRAWALALVVARLQDRDLRSLDTILQQQLSWSVPVLEEALAMPKAEPRLRARIIEVLQAFQASQVVAESAS